MSVTYKNSGYALLQPSFDKYVKKGISSFEPK